MKEYILANQNKGITLIGLVITIIVLLILVGVSIATLTGNNGILLKANIAKQETQKATAKEKAQLAVMGSFNQEGRLDYERLKTNLEKIEGIKKQDIPEIITDENFPIMVNIDGYEVTIGLEGTVTVGNEDSEVGEPTVPPEIEHQLASEVLIVNSEATEAEKKSPYVLYNDILCRVLYDVNSKYGLQLVSERSVEQVSLGINDNTVSESDFEYNGSITKEGFRHVVASWNNALDCLRTKAKNYQGVGDSVVDIRCLGSKPDFTIETKFYVKPVSGLEYESFLKLGLLKVVIVHGNSTPVDISALSVFDVPKEEFWLAHRAVTSAKYLETDRYTKDLRYMA